MSIDKKKIKIIAIAGASVAAVALALFFKGSAISDFVKNAGFGTGLKDLPKSARSAHDFNIDMEIFAEPKYKRLSEKYELENSDPKPGNEFPFGGK